jgi:phosphatidylserine/phosphatidylglycerophosphate/cardiolipin synthase-like enzyme
MMKLLLSIALIAVVNNAIPAELTASVEVFFSPNGGAADAVIREIDGAKSEIRVQAYSFTHAGIAKALADAERRGVNVEVILDKSNRTRHYSAADFVRHAGIPTYIDAKHAIAHNKIMVIDREEVLTGSFNFTKGADEKNAENLLVLHSRDLAKVYLDNWRNHKAHSYLFQ